MKTKKKDIYGNSYCVFLGLGWRWWHHHKMWGYGGFHRTNMGEDWVFEFGPVSIYGGRR